MKKLYPPVKIMIFLYKHHFKKYFLYIFLWIILGLVPVHILTDTPSTNSNISRTSHISRFENEVKSDESSSDEDDQEEDDEKLLGALGRITQLYNSETQCMGLSLAIPGTFNNPGSFPDPLVPGEHYLLVRRCSDGTHGSTWIKSFSRPEGRGVCHLYYSSPHVYNEADKGVSTTLRLTKITSAEYHKINTKLETNKYGNDY